MIKTYGQQQTGVHPSEANEMATFFAWLKRNHPMHHRVALHIRNEGKRTQNQASIMKMQGGFVKGASDIIIVAKVPFACELKSIDKKSRVSQDQIDFLNVVDDLGGFACICYGYKAMIEAFEVWIKENPL